MRIRKTANKRHKPENTDLLQSLKDIRVQPTIKTAIQKFDKLQTQRNDQSVQEK